MAYSIIPITKKINVTGKGDYIGVRVFVDKIATTSVKYKYTFSLKSGNNVYELKTYTNNGDVYAKDGKVLDIHLPKPSKSGYITNFLKNFTTASIVGRECEIVLEAERTDTTGFFSGTYKEKYRVTAPILLSCTGRVPDFNVSNVTKVGPVSMQYPVSMQKEIMSNGTCKAKVTVTGVNSNLYEFKEIQFMGVPGDKTVKLDGSNGLLETFESDDGITFERDVFTAPGTYKIAVKVKTTNGDVATKDTGTFTVYPYASPTLDVTNADREGYNPEANEIDKEEEYPIVFEATINTCNNTTFINEKPTCVAKIGKEEYEIPDTDIKFEETDNTKATINFTGKFGERGLKINEYIDFEVTVIDSTLEQTKITYRFGTAATTFHLKAGGRAATFGGFSGADDKDVLTSEWKIRAKAGIKATGDVSADEIITKKMKLNGTTISGVGIAEDNVAKGNHRHGSIGADGKAYRGDDIWNGSGVIFVNSSGDISVASKYNANYISTAAPTPAIDGTMKTAYVGDSTSLAKADHRHALVIANDPLSDKNMSANSLVTKNYVDQLYSKLQD